MKKIVSLKGIMFLSIMSLLFISCDNDDGNPIIPLNPVQSNIVQTAQNTDALSSLVAALSKADEKADNDLIGTLSGTGPFTVFAPNNDAFEALLASLDGFDSLEDFDTDEEKALLAQILTYHVVSGASVASTDLINGQTVGTVQSEELTISLDNGVFVQDATEMDAQVVLADVETSNGIVHVIDKVLVPQAVLDALEALANLQNIVELAVATNDLSSLVGALQQADAGLVDTLGGDGPFTVFAPTNGAFVALLEALGNDYNSLADFDTDEEKDLLAKVLTYHVVAGTKALSTDLSNDQEITTVQGENLTVDLEGGVFIEDATDSKATVVTPDVMAGNGVVHIIDKVLLPQEVIDLLN